MIGLGITGYGTQAIQPLPTINLPNDQPLLRTLDADLSALLAYQIALSEYERLLNTVDSSKTKITEIVPTTTATQIAAPDSNRVGFSIDNSSGVIIAIGLDPETSITRALKRYNPGEMFGFSGAETSGAIFLVGDIPASVIAQGFALYEFFNSGPVPPTPPALLNPGNSGPIASPGAGGNTLAAVNPASGSLSANTTLVVTLLPLAGKTVTVKIYDSADTQTAKWTGQTTVGEDGTDSMQVGGWGTLGATRGSTWFLTYDDGVTTYKTPNITLTA